MNFENNAGYVIKALERYYRQSVGREKPVLQQKSIAEIRELLDLKQLIEKGGLDGNQLDNFVNAYLDETTRLHHPGYMAHQVGIPHPSGSLGSLIDGFTNNAMAIYEMGPAAAAIEFFMINYLLEKVGWVPMPEKMNKRLTYPHGAGVLTHGGSLANMTALLTARNCLDPSVRETGTGSNLVLLAPETSHYSVAKSAGIIGIGEKNVVGLATDYNGRLLIDRILPVIREVRQQRKQIVALVANACSTGTGLYDPIDEIADICTKEKIWFHVDAAHGGGALFSKKYRKHFNGLEKADSIIIDAHKMLRTPTVCASLLVKNAYHIDHTFVHDASYLFHEKKQPGFDFISQVVECTKAGLGLKFFMSMAGLGEGRIETYIDTCYELTRTAYDYLCTQSDFYAPCKPESNILCFRYTGNDDDQILIRDRLIEDGQFYISSTELNKRRYLRIVIINPETGMSDIKRLVSTVRACS